MFLTSEKRIQKKRIQTYRWEVIGEITEMREGSRR
jgi:hypothetical protein